MNFLTKIDYMKNARIWIVVSLVLTIAGLGALFTKGLNLGIDFKGGEQLDIQFEQAITQEQLRETVGASLATEDVQFQAAELKASQIENWNPKTEFFVRTPEMTAEARAKLMKDLEALGAYKIVGEETVSGSISKELTQKAALAIAIAALLQVVYIWIRFEFKFGVTAVAALLHDLVITLGLMSIFDVQITSTFVAAILTVLGYSMNDTVVVIDRIRENLKVRKKNESLQALATRSIQEVITRSLYTGVSVQAMLISMLVLGGDSVWDFSMTLLIGITAGTYSSIFIASALWLFWQQWDEQNQKRAGASGRPAKA